MHAKCWRRGHLDFFYKSRGRTARCRAAPAQIPAYGEYLVMLSRVTSLRPKSCQFSGLGRSRSATTPHNDAGVSHWPTPPRAPQGIRRGGFRPSDAPIASQQVPFLCGVDLLGMAGVRRSERPTPHNHSLPISWDLCGGRPATGGPTATFGEAARLVMKGLLTNEQTLPMAPWEIRRSELDAEPFRAALEHYRRTGEYPEAGGKTDQL